MLGKGETPRPVPGREALGVRVQEFQTCALEHLDDLMAYGLQLSKNHEQAEDLVQETFIRAFTRCERLDSADAVRPVMFRILHNLFIDEWRAGRRGPVMISTDLLDEIADTPLLSHPGDNPREALFKHVLSDEVDRAFSDLEAHLREVLWLREVEGFSYAEISETTEAPVGTVRSRLARARRAFAEKLEGYAGRSRQAPPSVDKGDNVVP